MSPIISRSRYLARSRGQPHVTKPTLTAGVDKLYSVGGTCEVERRVLNSSWVASARNGGVYCGVTWYLKGHAVGVGMAGGCCGGRIGVAGGAGGPLHIATGGTGHVAAVLAFVGVLVTAAASIIGLTVSRQSSRASENRLRLDAAMRAGESFSSRTSEPVNSASVASSLLALTKLDNVDLAVALLVDFWLPGVEDRISDEAAILVVDAALRSGKPNAQLVAAEMLCRNPRTYTLASRRTGQAISTAAGIPGSARRPGCC